jgi:hypothetical protein
MAGSIPAVGKWLLIYLRGGEEVTGATLTRFFGFHVAVLPGLATLIIGVHLLLVQRFGISVPPSIEKQWAAQFPRPPLKSLIDHIDHVAKVAGIDHVGLGSDFDGVSSLPEGIDSVADLPKITQALYERGYTRAQIHKILGGNFLRVMRQVEAVSRQIQAEQKESDALTFDQVELMLGNYMTSAHLIDLIHEHGVNFDLTPERREKLKAEKASDSVLDAIASGKRK